MSWLRRLPAPLRLLLWIVLGAAVSFAWWSISKKLPAGDASLRHLTGPALFIGVPFIIHLGFAWVFGFFDIKARRYDVVAMALMGAALLPFGELFFILIGGCAINAAMHVAGGCL